MEDVQILGILVALSLLPPLLFAIWVRNHERHGREPWWGVLQAFAFGGTIGALVAVTLNTFFETAAIVFGLADAATSAFLVIIIVAPFVEEATKGMGLGSLRRRITELEDGLVYGAAIGLGFAATENLVYGISAWVDDGAGIAVQVLIMRIISSTVLHAGASALLGFGYARAVLGKGIGAQVMPAYLLAVVIHSLYNVLVTLQTTIALIAALVIVWAIFMVVRRRIQMLDALPHDSH